ncbi:glycine cleavage system protein GcvH [Desulfobotulus sp. H1]|uniref:Glycine cleavage system H protein n=1 Tax=Desulfobotulus pelophilus TaxID=2823377 RepID=A0ABT3NAE0_9BACT|nr:glycine cleavage system protein GcvH [Desulfobotulus pelophilus]MCW7754433.1 glycine cleavage system protein GcvH [Desulfobotulus pelophilus]
MKEMEDIRIPEHLRYSEGHEWISAEAIPLRMGVTDYAQDQLGDVVFVELPEPGTRFERGDVCATVESVKAVSEVYMPLSGTITGVNRILEDSPETVNVSPYDEGWIMEITPDDPADLGHLMDSDAYRNILKGL